MTSCRRFEVLSKLSPMFCPMLILDWEKGEQRRKEHKLLQGIAGTRLVLIPEAGHIPQLDDPEGIIRVVLDFFG